MYDFRGFDLTLLISFLNNINQCVKFNNAESQINNIKFGIPKESVLAPLLFIIFIIDIIESKKKTSKSSNPNQPFNIIDIFIKR